jgi:hypothetical protein
MLKSLQLLHLLRSKGETEMATFKVGQRVKLISTKPTSSASDCVGKAGVITAIPGEAIVFETGLPHDCDVAIDGERTISAMFFRLVPLTDPRADEFIADMERFSKVAAKTEPMKVLRESFKEGA